MSNIPLKNVGFHSKARKICLYGTAGIGKSASIATLLLKLPENGRIVYLMTERNAPMGFEWGLRHYKINPKAGQIFYVIVEDSADSFENLSRAFTDFHQKPQTIKHDVLSNNVNKEKYTFFRQVIQGMASFEGTDYVTGETKKLGSFNNLGENDFVVIDGLSVIVSEIWNSLYGDVLVVSGFDYSAPQRVLYTVLSNLSKIRSHVIVLAHEKDYTEGEGLVQKLMFVGPDTKMGFSNFTSLMGTFTDVIRANKFGTKYIWETKRTDKVFAVCREGIPEKTLSEALPANFSLLPFMQEL